MPRGFLVALEGVDGSGKTTQAELLAASLEKDGRKVVLTREPSNGPAGQKLRAYLAGPSRHWSPAEELQLFMEDRREHVDQVIKPALKQGKVVITDRYYYSSVAYQGSLGLDPNDILAANEAFAPRPDLVFLLDLPVTEALARLAKKGKAARQVSESFPYLRQVAASYANFKGPRFRRLDATQPPMVVHATILAEVRRALLEAS
jgi:dTMP kinase